LIVLVIFKVISGPAVKDLLQQLKLPPYCQTQNYFITLLTGAFFRFGRLIILKPDFAPATIIIIVN